MLTGEDLLAKKWHVDFEYEQYKNRGYILLIRGPEATIIWVYHGLPWYVEYSMNEKKKLDKV